MVTGTSHEGHLCNLATVFERLKHHSFRLKADKWEFMKDSVEFLAHKIDADGLHAMPGKVEAIVRVPEPRNIQELRSFLGLINYYGKFVSNLSTLVRPLNSLLQRNKKWKWSQECSQAFSQAKQALSSASILAHYDPSLPLTMAGDASAYGIGAVISHRFSRRHWQTYCLCFTFSFSKWAKLFTNWERSSLTHFWSQEIPYVPVWSEVSACYQPQATSSHLVAIERHSLSGCCLTAAMGCSTVCLPVWDSV